MSIFLAADYLDRMQLDLEAVININLVVCYNEVDFTLMLTILFFK